MFTLFYKGFYINGYCNKAACRVVSNDGLERIAPNYKNLTSAKRAISKHLNAGKVMV